MAKAHGAVYVAEIKTRYKDKVYTSYLLRRTYRENGKVKQQTLGNLSALPLEAIALLRGTLRGQKYIPDYQALETRRSWHHGHVAAVGAMLRRLGLDRLLDPLPADERERVVALIIARVVAPQSKSATVRWWQSTTLALSPAVGEASADDLDEAMDWLEARQPRVERALARRHLHEGGLVLYDLTSSYVEGTHCPLAARGYNRDGKVGKKQVNYGLILDPQGRPVAVQVYRGNTADPQTIADQAIKLKQQYRLAHVVLVGDRGMLTSARIDDLRTKGGIDWISALRNQDIQALATTGAVSRSMFDEQDLVEIASPDYPGERLILCRNPLLAEDRARKRRELLGATEVWLAQLAKRVAAGRLKQAAKIGQALGRALNRFKVGKHFACTVDTGRFSYQRREDSIAREAALDGIYVVRTSVPATALASEQAVSSYKSLQHAEQAFRHLKSVDIRIRPLRHWTARRVRAHIFLCMLAYYVQWHLRQAWAPYLFEDEAPGRHQDDSVVLPALRSEAALAKARTKRTPDGEEVHSFATLLHRLSAVVQNEVGVPAHPEIAPFAMITTPDSYQSKLFGLVGLEVTSPRRQKDTG